MTTRACIVRDERYLEHKTGHVHPEQPGRLRAVYGMLDTEFDGCFLTIRPDFAPLEYLELVHTPIYIEKVLKTAEHDFTSLAPDTPASAKTYLAAWLAAGGCISGMDALIAGMCDVCFALVRPPGHHAMPDRAGGFCVFNNLGVAARYAIEHHGLKRILIVDWDIHHGNGLQNLFYKEKEVLYFSTHDILLYPYSGSWEETGEGEGRGFTVNIPVPRELEDGEFLLLYQEILGPIVLRYRPEMILVAAGFDASHEDPLGRSLLAEQTFGWLTRLILGLRAKVSKPAATPSPEDLNEGIPVLLALEGGYQPRALMRSVREVLKGMREGPAEDLPVKRTPRAMKLIEKARRIHAGYEVWTDASEVHGA
jgi:acetoin utilization deacetylase AcuC-like enzyme